MEFKIKFAKKTKVEVIDEAEGTPGSSRQFTRFNQECKRKIEEMIDAQKKTPGVTLESILNASNFKLVGIRNESESVMIVTIESTEK